jgi:hypothetical protein
LEPKFSAGRRFRFEASWSVMLILASLVAVYAVAFLLVPSTGSPDLKAKFARMPIATWSHLLGGAAALLCGPWQFRAGLREARPGFHRLTGRVYALAVAAGGLGGLAMAVVSDGGYVTHFGFGMLGIAWLVTLTAALRAVRRRDFTAHRAWMIRNFALTFAAVTLRIYLPISAALGIPFLSAYRVISWLAWAPNLVIVEWFLRRQAPQWTNNRSMEGKLAP